MPKAAAFIPARSGSERVLNKNIRLLDDHPLLAYSVCAAIDSGVFDAVICATDSETYAEIACYYGAEVPMLRPAEISGEKSPDIEWVEWIFDVLKKQGRSFEVFSILRPTSPFRLPATICRAWEEFQGAQQIDSLRAIEKCAQHPGKMWQLNGEIMEPLLPLKHDSGQPWHSCQYQSLPEIYVQNASLEIAWSRVVSEDRTISGKVVKPFFTKDLEGFDVNKPNDWELAEKLVQSCPTALPTVSKKPYGKE